MLLKGKTAIVTGSNRGIGRAIVEEFASNGANIYAHARKESPEFIEDMCSVAQKYGVTVAPVFFDMTDHAAMKSAVRGIISEKKSVDILVNNAGVAHGALLQMTALDDAKKVFEVNFFGPFLLTQLMSKLMIRQKNGRIINIASVSGLDGREGTVVYGSSKAALIHATVAASAELAKYNITVNAVAPGITDTDMLESMEKNALESQLRSIALGRVARPLDVAGTAVFLASDLSAYVTGQVIRVDGGRK